MPVKKFTPNSRSQPKAIARIVSQNGLVFLSAAR